MIERPILMSAPMVRAILEGRKTMTRRIVKPPKWSDAEHAGVDYPCPYGCAGDRLWVRETWLPGGNISYLATSPGDGSVKFHWKPSIHMPRRASRITLEVTGVLVERVQEISEADAKAEGCEATNCGMDGAEGPGFSYRQTFRSLWDSINAKRGYGWDVNPHVWVVAFNQVQP